MNLKKVMIKLKELKGYIPMISMLHALRLASITILTGI